MDCVFIEGLTLEGRHGLFDEERERGNHFLVDVKLFGPAVLSDDIDDAMDYRKAAAAVERVFAGKTLKLVESLAESIASEVLAEVTQCQEVQVRVAKLDPPMASSVAAAGVEIVRRRG